MDISGGYGVSPSRRGATNKPVPNVKTSEEIEQSRRDVGSSRDISKAAPAAPIDATQQVEKPQAAKPIETVSRALTDKDLVDQLLLMEKSPTSSNKELLRSMLSHGLTATPEAFEMIDTLLKGRKKGKALESAVVSYGKGIDSSKSVDVLSQFFANQTTVTHQLDQLKQSLTQFKTILLTSRNLLEKGLFTGLTSVISDLDEQFKKLLRKSNDDKLNLSLLKREELVSSLKLLSGFLGGLDKQLEKSNKGTFGQVSAMRGKMSELKSLISKSLDGFIAQLILSKDSEHIHLLDQFAVWQFPNPMATRAADITVLVKHNPRNKKRKINPKNTRIVVKFETPDLGEVSVVVQVKDNKVSYEFYSTNGETKQYVAELTSDLRDRMAALNYDLTGVKNIVKPLDIAKLLVPVFNLDEMTRIIVEA